MAACPLELPKRRDHGRDSRPLAERLFSPPPAQRGRGARWVCESTQSEIDALAAPFRRGSSDGQSRREWAADGVRPGGTAVKWNRPQRSAPLEGPYQRGDRSSQLCHGTPRRHGLFVYLERAARKRQNGALGASRAPAHYQAILPEVGISDRALRLWCREACSPRPTQQTSLWVSSPMSGPTPMGSSVDDVPSPGS